MEQVNLKPAKADLSRNVGAWRIPRSCTHLIEDYTIDMAQSG